MIERIELAGREPQLQLVGAVVVPAGASGIGSAPGFPPRRDRFLRADPVEAVGARVEPLRGIEMIIGVMATAPGEHSFDYVAIHHRAGGERYRSVYTMAVTVCAPKTRNCD